MLKSCYSKLTALKLVKRFTSFQNRKTLAQALILSKLDYCNILYSSISSRSLKRLQKVINSTAAYVNGRFSKVDDVLTLGWLPAKERIDFSLLKLAHKALHNEDFPQYLKLEFKQQHERSLRSNSDVFKIKRYGNTNYFRDSVYKKFNSLPIAIRSNIHYDSYCRKLKRYMLDTSIAQQVQN